MLLDIIRLDFVLKVRFVGTVVDSLEDHHSRPPVTDTGSCEPAFVVKVGGLSLHRLFELLAASADGALDRRAGGVAVPQWLGRRVMFIG